MYVSKAISSTFICSTCRAATARSSATVSRPQILASPATFSPKSRPSKTPRCAAFSTSIARSADRNDPTAEDPEFSFLDDAAKPAAAATPAQDLESLESTLEEVSPEATIEEASAVRATTKASPASVPPVEFTASTQDASVPWYLRQQSAARSPAQQTAELPDLPPNPPPLLETLLEYVSVTAGLDDLQLLDLRDLDPPPALGTKLIMIIATARSEKHLHVSADRFCRFLRREHGLKANAAGLLGRNELKIKLRRKAKRMRMLANVGGAAPEGNIDDGIRTGWICCTLGKLEAHPDDTHMPGDDVKEFVGFRDVKPGVNVVVQMFTEEKRAETDLETLWGGVLKTHARKDRTADEALQALEQDIEDLEDDVEDEQMDTRPAPAATKPPVASKPVRPPSPAQQLYRPRSTPGDVFPPASSAEPRRQLRRLHTVGLR